MKIIDVAGFFSEQGGGVRTYILQKLMAGAAAGHDMAVIAPGVSDRVQEVPGGRIIWVKGRPEPFDRRYFRFGEHGAIHRILDAESPDVVEASSTWGGARAVSSWAGSAVRSLVLHQDPVAVFGHSFLDRLLPVPVIDALGWPLWHHIRATARRFHTSIVAGPGLGARMTAFGLPDVKVVPFGVDRSLFRPDRRSMEMKAHLRAACGLADQSDGPLLIAVSRHHPEKRVGTIIAGFARANASLPAGGKAGLVLVGDGPFSAMVRRQAGRWPHIHIAGKVSDRARLASMVASADAFLHGGAAETFGIVLAESMCAGTPLIVPSRGGAADLAEPDFSCSYTPGNVAECAQAIIRLLAHDPARLRQAAQTAGERLNSADAHFNLLLGHYSALRSHHGVVAASGEGVLKPA